MPDDNHCDDKPHSGRKQRIRGKENGRDRHGAEHRVGDVMQKTADKGRANGLAKQDQRQADAGSFFGLYQGWAQG